MPNVRAHNYVIQTNFRSICCPEIYTSHCLKLVAVQIGHFSHCDADISLELLKQRAIPLSRNEAYCLLQKCEGKQNLDYGRIVQFLVVHSGLDSTAVLGDHLIRVFTRHGSLLEAHQAFSKIAQPSVYTWTEVVMANAKLGQTAIDLYEKMYVSAERSDKHIYVAILKACLKRKALFQTRIIHEQIILDGFMSDLIISNTLIKAYAKCGSIEEAYKVFAILPNRDIVTWNAVIAAHAQHGDVLLALMHFEKMQQEGISPDLVSWNTIIGACAQHAWPYVALQLFVHMQEEGIELDKVTFLNTLKACTSILHSECGRLIHAQIIKSKFHSDEVLGNSLIDIYAKCGYLEEAHAIFRRLLNQDVVSWGSIITGFVHNECSLLALQYFQEMQLSSIEPDEIFFASILKACSIFGALGKGRFIQEQFICCYLKSIINMEINTIGQYSKWGSLKDLSQSFIKVPKQTTDLWAMMGITEYAWDGKHNLALECVSDMQAEVIQLNELSLSIKIIACSRIGSIEQGRLVHGHIIEMKLQSDVLCNAIISMYLECKSLREARNALKGLSARDEMSWNPIIVGYAEQANGILALESWREMEEEGIDPNEAMFQGVLLAFSNNKALEYGRFIHEKLIERKKQLNSIENALMEMYAKCGSLEEMRIIFCRLLNPDVTSWSTIIAGYSQHEEDYLALEYFMKMQENDIKPNENALLSAMESCGRIQAVEMGRLIHGDIIASCSQSSVAIWNTIVYMYAQCGRLEEAQKAFDFLPVHNVVSWGTLILGHAQNKREIMALTCFDMMEKEGIKPDNMIILSILKACGEIGRIEQGRVFHELLINNGVESVVLFNALIGMYTRCGSVDEASKVLDKMPTRNIVSWNIVIAELFLHRNCALALQHFEMMHHNGLKANVVSWNVVVGGYLQCNEFLLALECLQQMPKEGVEPNEVTTLSLWKACAGVQAIQEGRLFHGKIIHSGLQLDLEVWNASIDMYVKCGSLAEACSVFNNMDGRSVVSWNVLIAGYAQHAESFLAVKCYEEMEQEGIKPDAITFMSILKACTNIGAIEQARSIHERIFKEEIQLNTCLGNTLIDMYAKCGSLKEAYAAFDALQNQDVVSWNVLIAGYTYQGMGVPAIECFVSMQNEDITPNEISFLNVLKACAIIHALEYGRLIHVHIIETEAYSDVIGNTLVDMYGKSGSLEEAQKAFCKISLPNVVSWGAIIGGYAQHGDGILALECFEKMQQEGIRPDEVSFSSILIACGRSGLVDEGHWYLKYMKDYCGIVPSAFHNTCFADLLGRAGFLNRAENLLKNSLPTNVMAWTSLLNACKVHGGLEVGSHCFEQILLLNSSRVSNYFLMSSIYANRLDDCTVQSQDVSNRLNVSSSARHGKYY